MSMKQCRSQMIFEISNSAADSWFPNPDGNARLSEAAMLSRGDKIAEMAEFNARQKDFAIGTYLRPTKGQTEEWGRSVEARGQTM